MGIFNKITQILNKEKQYGICSMCGKKFLDSDLQLVDTLSFCKKDFKLYNQNEWYCILQSTSDPNNPEEALKTQELKDTLAKHEIPSYILVDYHEKAGVFYSNFSLYIPLNKNEEFTKLNLHI